MANTTHDEICGLLGEVDQHISARLIETGASIEDIAAACYDLRADEVAETMTPLALAVRAVLLELPADESDVNSYGRIDRTRLSV